MLPYNTRIAFLAPISHPIPPVGYSPYELDIYDLARGLVELGYRDITLYTDLSSTIPGVKTVGIIEHPLSIVPQTNPRQAEEDHVRFALDHARKNADIIHNHMNYWPLLTPEAEGQAIITTLHGAGVEADAKAGYREAAARPYIAMSAYERTIIPELNYVATIANPIDTDTFTAGDGPAAEPYLVNVGRINPIKGIHNAIDLARRVHMPLKLAGPVSTEHQGYFDEVVAPAIADGTVEYLGNLNPLAVRDLIAGATAFVGLIEWEEPFGRAVAEAMSCGTPVIVTPRGAHVETVKDGVSGILVGSAAEAAERFDEIALIDRAAVRRWAVDHFSIPAICRSHAEAFARVIDHSRI